MVATLLLLLVHVPAVTGLGTKVVCSPKQRKESGTETVGPGVTETAVLASEIQPVDV
jgi:hypothetical protein